MRRLLTCGAVALVLVLPACTSGPAAPAARDTGADLDVEHERLVTELTALPTVTTAAVRLRAGATSGNQVLIDAATASGDVDEQRAALEGITRAGWNTSAFVPTEVRASLVAPDGTTLDARDLGFPRRGADPAGLFDRFGAPAADEDWQP